jgi:hypothetical protein
MGATHIELSGSEAHRFARRLVTTYLRHVSRQSQATNYPLLSNGSVNKFPWR